MALAWGGADPTEVADGSDYELGTEYEALTDITMTRVRVWSGAGEVSISPRRARVWSTAGTQLGIAVLPDNLPDGWSEHDLTDPVELLNGTNFVVSYSTGGNYGIVAGGVASSVPSGDGFVRTVAPGLAANGNGIFNNTPGSFPTDPSGTNHFYGPDFVYDVGIGGNTAPIITALTATAAGAVVTATVAFTDAETSVGATTRFVWGDGEADTVVNYPTVTAQHTYAASGTYAVLATVTDASGATDYDAVPVTVHVPSSEVDELDTLAIFNALVTHVKSLGLFDKVNQHDPDNAPGHGLSAALWTASLAPTASSGMGISSGRVVISIRISSSLQQKPADMIDPNIVRATDRLMAAYIGDFTLGGLVRQVDVHGAHGTGLNADFGYRPMDENRYRIAILTVPLIANDLWEQVA